MATIAACVVCFKPVRRRMHAIACDACSYWVHRQCGTGITRETYLAAVRNGDDIPFVCPPCKMVDNYSHNSSSDQQDITAMEVDVLPDAASNQPSSDTASNQPTTEVASNQPSSDVLSNEPVPESLSDDEDVRSERRVSFLVDEPFSVPRPIHEQTIVEDDDHSSIELDDGIHEVTYEVVDSGTKRGQRKLVDSLGFQYSFWRSGKHTSSWWRTKRSRHLNCPATVTLTGATFIRGTKDHIHPPEPGVDIAVKISAESRMRSAESIFTTSAPNIVEDIMRKFGNSTAPAASRPKIANLVRSVNHSRQSQRPTDPKDLNFILDESFMRSHTPDLKTVDIDAGSRRHLLVYTDRQIELLASAKTWYMDGTFRVVNKPWTQLFSIHAFIRSDGNMKQIPIVFCFMSGKREEDYYQVLRAVDHLLPSTIKLEKFVCDFEAALWVALRDRFEGYEIQGCVFHWTQTVFRKKQEKGLQTAYQKKGDVHDFLKEVMALPFLPLEHIRGAFDKLDEQAWTAELQDIMDYVYRTWIVDQYSNLRNGVCSCVQSEQTMTWRGITTD